MKPDGSPVGYSITIMEEILATAFPNAETNIVFVENNEDVFQAVESFDFADNPTEFVVGAAAISVTKEREERLDFLPSYFQSGIQVLARTSESTAERIEILLTDTATFFVGIFIAVLLLILMLTPLVWFLETAYSGREVSCFHVTEQEAIAKGQVPNPKRQVLLEVFTAGLWTASIVSGVKVGYPKSKPARVIAFTLKVLHLIIVVLTTATVTALFTTAALKADVSDFQELGGKTVCTVENTTPDAFVTDNNQGFQILRARNIPDMMANFWEKRCDAVVYDYPILYQAVLDRRQTGKKAPAALVGEPLNEDPYAAVVPDGAPYFELLAQSTILKIRDTELQTELRGKWFNEADVVAAEGEVEDIPASVFWIPVVIAMGLLLIASVWFFRNKSQVEARRHEFDARNHTDDFNWVRFNTLRKGKADITFRDDSDLIHEIAMEQRDIKRLLCEALLLLSNQSKKEVGGLACVSLFCSHPSSAPAHPPPQPLNHSQALLWEASHIPILPFVITSPLSLVQPSTSSTFSLSAEQLSELCEEYAAGLSQSMELQKSKSLEPTSQDEKELPFFDGGFPSANRAKVAEAPQADTRVKQMLNVLGEENV
ncbi:unnamed protein product [Chrysoparadoxa australica]